MNNKLKNSLWVERGCLTAGNQCIFNIYKVKDVSELFPCDSRDNLKSDNAWYAKIQDSNLLFILQYCYCYGCLEPFDNNLNCQCRNRNSRNSKIIKRGDYKWGSDAYKTIAFKHDMYRSEAYKEYKKIYQRVKSNLQAKRRKNWLENAGKHNIAEVSCRSLDLI